MKRLLYNNRWLEVFVLEDIFGTYIKLRNLFFSLPLYSSNSMYDVKNDFGNNFRSIIGERYRSILS